ncbi:phytase [Paremcibacter congregatus]|uniref:3-phytase n=1 Tax=Paremcibacter congregatus TaxID=2043170 RepID=A0A2G4YW14_9PROT|nr:phytase [Paremcibacter congregatus]PHZ86534.1 3-phytase [Paremcibacter congregatus]QDE26337.1 phytase [Paremcibacter congregatus]
MEFKMHNKSLKPIYISFVTILLQSCSITATQATTDQKVFEINHITETEPSLGNNANSAIYLTYAASPSRNMILTADETFGIDILTASGKRSNQLEIGQIESLALQSSFSLAGQEVPLVAALDTAANQVSFFIPNQAHSSLTSVSAGNIDVSFPTKGICFYQSPLDRNHYLYIVGEGGHMEQWVIYDNGAGKVAGRAVRSLRLGSEVGFCAADSSSGYVYAAEEANGIWKLKGDPETDATPQIVDIVKFGQIDGEVAGLALYQDLSGHNLLIASNASSNSFNVYDLNNDDRYLGRFTVPGVEESAGLFASPRPLTSQTAKGALVLSDDDNGDQALNFKVLSWADIAQSLNLSNHAVKKTPALTSIKTVTPTVETTPVTVGGDAADDPAIWVHPTDPGQSLVIGTDKKSGLYVYDLAGKVKQFLPDGKVNNVDVRYGFSLNGEKVDIVSASNRTEKSISLYKADATGHLSNISDGIQGRGMEDPYGYCMYHSRKTGKYYAILNGDEGQVKQFELRPTKQGRISLSLVREFTVGSQTEGCVADDDTGALYIGEEDVALWKYGAEPEDGTTRQAVIHATDHKNLEVDIEGVSLYYGQDGAGYIIASSQGNNSYAVFDRTGDNAYLGSFAVVANGPLGIDGSSETDGLDVISTPLGSTFPYGVFIAQDGRNISPAENQNFKLVPWERIATQLNLKTYTGWTPRRPSGE